MHRGQRRCGRPDAPDGRGQSARRTRGGGASYALDGLALQERKDLSTSAVLATGIVYESKLFATNIEKIAKQTILLEMQLKGKYEDESINAK